MSTLPLPPLTMNTTPQPACFGAHVSHGRCGVIELHGELDLAGAPMLEAAARDLRLPAIRDAVLDLRRLTFIDAAGLNAVVDLYAECLNTATSLTIIPGPRNADEFRANLELLRHPIPPALWQELKHAKLLHPDAPTPG